MAAASPPENNTGRWLALTAALLGWMFDGFEMGLFPNIARPALKELLGFSDPTAEQDKLIGDWNSLINSAFLIGAATGGVVFGWLGDRLGRVRAMTLSILTYAICSGLSGLTTAAWQMVLIRFVAALGMGGEWSLGVALVMEVWKGQSRAVLAGVIGAAANVGYLLVGVLGLGIIALRQWLLSLGLSESWVEWRLLMVCGALPALLTFFIRQFVPESESWEQERDKGKTTGWHSRDLLSVVGGVLVLAVLLTFWRLLENPWAQLAALVVALVMVTTCYLYPIQRYLIRSQETPETQNRILRTMLLGALLSGIPLLATWGAVQWAPLWAAQLGEQAVKAAPTEEQEAVRAATRSNKEHTQMASALGAVLGCIVGAAFAGWAGRRIAYVLLCLTSLASVWWFFLGNTQFGVMFLIAMFFAGFFSAAFYGWLPLYLPELFPTRVRATGQGFSFNFGRILAAVGVLQVPVLMGSPPNFPQACSSLALIYLLGVVVIWLAPETHGRPLPE
jgi:MFS family permease